MTDIPEEPAPLSSSTFSESTADSVETKDTSPDAVHLEASDTSADAVHLEASDMSAGVVHLEALDTSSDAVQVAASADDKSNYIEKPNPVQSELALLHAEVAHMRKDLDMLIKAVSSIGKARQ